MKSFNRLIKSFGLALIGMMSPRIIWLSFRPFIIVSIAWGCLIWLCWSPALETLSAFLTNSLFSGWIQEGLIWTGFDQARAWIAPLFFVMLIIPLIAISLLVLIAFTTVPLIIRMITRQAAYSDLAYLHGGNLIHGIFYAVWSTCICIMVTLVTLPVWWLPPLVAVLPPLLWGWLTMRLMSYDVLASHARKNERDLLLLQYRWPLLFIGVACGMLSAIPTFFWATSAFALILFPVLSFMALWIYSLIFIFSALWFAHFLLDSLKEMRNENLDRSLRANIGVIDAEL